MVEGRYLRCNEDLMGLCLGIAVTPSKWRACPGHCSIPYSSFMEGEGFISFTIPHDGSGRGIADGEWGGNPVVSQIPFVYNFVPYSHHV